MRRFACPLDTWMASGYRGGHPSRSARSCGAVVAMDTVPLTGRAAHGSRYDIGIDAITHVGLVLAELDKLERTRESDGVRHPLLGRGSLHASKIRGGVGMSTYPEECALAVERRTLPGESEQT